MVSRTLHRNKRYILLEIIVIVWNCPVSLGWFLISASAYCSPGILHVTSPFVLGTVYVCSSSGKESIGGCRWCLLQGRVSCGTSSVQHLLFCFKGIGMEWVSVGLVHVWLCLYLPWSYSPEAKAKLNSSQTLCLVHSLFSILKPNQRPQEICISKPYMLCMPLAGICNSGGDWLNQNRNGLNVCLKENVELTTEAEYLRTP